MIYDNNARCYVDKSLSHHLLAQHHQVGLFLLNDGSQNLGHAQWEEPLVL